MQGIDIRLVIDTLIAISFVIPASLTVVWLFSLLPGAGEQDRQLS